MSVIRMQKIANVIAGMALLVAMWRFKLTEGYVAMAVAGVSLSVAVGCMRRRR